MFCWGTTRLLVQRPHCTHGWQVTAQRLITEYTWALRKRALGRLLSDRSCSRVRAKLFSWPKRSGLTCSAFGTSTRDFSRLIQSHFGQMSGVGLQACFTDTLRTAARIDSGLYCGFRTGLTQHAGDDKVDASGPLLSTLEDGLSGPRCLTASALNGAAAQKGTATGDRTTTERPSSGSPGKAPPEPGDGKLTKAQQLKKVFKEYGAVGVAFHVGISLVSLGVCYAALSSGIDMTALLFKLGFSEAVVHSKMAAGTSTFVLAYAVHKLLAPVRISITLVSVPLLVRYFRKTGLFKPPASAP